jgi:hypothetical protein
MSKSSFILLLSFFAGTRNGGDGSFVMGKTVDGNRFMVNFTHIGIYDKNSSLSADSLLASQMIQENHFYHLSVVQLDVYSNREYEPEVDMADFKCQLNHKLPVWLLHRRLLVCSCSSRTHPGYVDARICLSVDNHIWQPMQFMALALLYDKAKDMVILIANPWNSQGLSLGIAMVLLR